MNTYIFYLVYVGAVVAISILLLRRGTGRKCSVDPDVLEAAFLRGGPGAVVETIIFDLQERNLITLVAERTGKKLLAQIPLENLQKLSKLEVATVEVFEEFQGKSAALKSARQQMDRSLSEIKADMQEAGWLKKPAFWSWGLTVLSPGLIVAGSLRFINFYEGTLQVALALTVPLLAVLARRVVLHELASPTSQGKAALRRLRSEKTDDSPPLWRVALHGTRQLQGLPEYRLFCFMTRGIPYWKL